MKKLLLLVFIVSTPLFSNAQSSNYHAFPDSNAVWNFKYQQMWGCDIFEYSIELLGDTLINNLIYHKLIIPYVSENCNVKKGYQGAIRQDTTQKKVYFFAPDSSSEQLLYDFTMEVGDNLKGYLAIDFTTYRDTVAKIDSVLVNGIYRKRWYLNHCCPIKI